MGVKLRFQIHVIGYANANTTKIGKAVKYTVVLPCKDVKANVNAASCSIDGSISASANVNVRGLSRNFDIPSEMWNKKDVSHIRIPYFGNLSFIVDASGYLKGSWWHIDIYIYIYIYIVTVCRGGVSQTRHNSVTECWKEIGEHVWCYLH